jgi:predicted ATPase
MPKAITQLVGQSPVFRKALDDAAVAARLDSPVLIFGETGSGKGVLAEYVHRKSGRPGRLVSLNCASFQQNLFESELFGHMKGAFTGAVKDTPGLFEAAQGGTLFLDEIGDTPAELQPKLLRALEEGVVRRVGGTREIDVDVRLVCATNRDLKELIAEGKFREDLYYRINSFVVTVPPLRERLEDLRELARHFIEEATGGAPLKLSVEVIDALEAYAWPGNVRELRSAMQFAAAQSRDRDTILLADLPESLQGLPKVEADTGAQHLEAFEKLYRAGAEDHRLWAEFLLTLSDHLGTVRFARGDILACLRAIRGPEPTNNSLVNEWTRHIKPIPLRLGLIHEEGKKVRIDLDACHRTLRRPEQPAPRVDRAFEVVDDDEADTDIPTETQPPLSERVRHTNIGAARTTFIGRQSEQRLLRDLIMRGKPNVVTLTGPGGTGKTRLAREMGRLLTGVMPGGAWFADLTESRNIEGVAYAVAHALSVPLTGNQSPELAIGEILRERPPCLLILDNFEQVAEAASATVSEWADAAGQVRFLVTSRALLGIEGEQEIELEPLHLADENESLESISRSEAVRLFVERARVHHIGFELDSQSAAAVARICKRLEGMPLAIELAAARTVIMNPEQIAERMDRMFSVLRSSRRDLSPRQRSLEATLDWSFDLLNEAERHAFAQLSLFRGGFFLDAAENVLDMSRFPDAPPVMDLVQSLREKSLLRAVGTPYETRFHMYQVIREYARDRWLEIADETERAATARRFADYYHAYASEWDTRTNSADAIEALDRLDLARSNIEAVLDWAYAGGHDQMFVELTTHFYNLLRVRGPAKQRVPALARALQVHGERDTATRVRLLFLQSQAEREAGDPVNGAKLAEQAVTVAERLGDAHLLATARFNLAGIEYAADNVERAQELHRQALPVFREVGNHLNAARVLSRMALLEANLDNFDKAIEYSEESEGILREQGDVAGLAWALATRGSMYNRYGRHREALEFIERAERIYIELEDRRMIANCLGNRALMTRQLRRFDEAERLVKECNVLVRELGDHITLAKNQMNAGIMYIELERYDQAESVLKEGDRLFEQSDHPHLRATCIENLAFIAGKRGDLQQARAGFERALEMYGDGEENRAGVHAAFAEILLDHGLKEEAAGHARKAVEYWRSQSNNRQRDFFRALAAHAAASDDSAAADEALSVAELIGFTAEDPSPLVRSALSFLKNLRTA